MLDISSLISTNKSTTKLCFIICVQKINDFLSVPCSWSGKQESQNNVSLSQLRLFDVIKKQTENIYVLISKTIHLQISEVCKDCVNGSIDVRQWAFPLQLN